MKGVLGARSSAPDEFYVLKSGTDDGYAWKVTARFTVQLTSKQNVACVRLRPIRTTPLGSLCFSEAEFKRLFVPFAFAITKGPTTQ